MTKKIRNGLLVATACLMLAGAKAAWADDEMMAGGTCCHDGTACSPGQACCRKKSPAAPCSSDQAMECVSSSSDCE
jgi:hypothetical protein